jgi:hypothetical protein
LDNQTKITMLERIKEAIRLASRDSAQIPALARLSEFVIDWEDTQVDELLHQLTGCGDELKTAGTVDVMELGDATSRRSSSAVGLDRVFQPLIHHLVVREMRRKLHSHSQPNPPSGTPDDVAGSQTNSRHQVGHWPSHNVLTASLWSTGRMRDFQALYQRTPAGSELRNHLLRWLATAGGTDQLELWKELVCHDPPEHRLGIGLAFAPLMNRHFMPTDELLQGLLNEGTAHPQIAPAVFELLNFFVRNKKLSSHPAQRRLPELVELLGLLCGQMGRIEEGDFPEGLQVRQINQRVSDSVALIVALCDTFALTCFRPAIPKLYQALQLRHRRVQTEAAASLARLDDPGGKQALIELAEQPIARLRALAYAEELGFKQDVSLELQGEIAIAESQLAIWLAEPDQMGLAPSKLELVDSRTMYWPSYEQSIKCYLFKYFYGSGANAHSNIGICGPLTHAFPADLGHLPIDEIYGAFAGWQTVHDEIFQMSLAKARQLHPNEMRRLERSLEDEAFEDLKIRIVGSFFGELILVASAIHEGQSGTVVVDNHDSVWFEEGNPEAPIDWRTAYGIWRGKQLLNRFNSAEN